MLDGGKISLCLLNFCLQLLEGADVSLDINAVLFLERLDEMVSDSLIEILTTEMSISSSSKHLKDSVIDSQDGNIKGTTTEIEDNNILLVLPVETVCDSGSRWLVDNTENLEASNNTGIFGCLSLSVVKVSWNGDDGVLDVLTEVLLSDLLHLGEDHC